MHILLRLRPFLPNVKLAASIKLSSIENRTELCGTDVTNMSIKGN